MNWTKWASFLAHVQTSCSACLFRPCATSHSIAQKQFWCSTLHVGNLSNACPPKNHVFSINDGPWGNSVAAQSILSTVVCRSACLCHRPWWASDFPVGVSRKKGSTRGRLQGKEHFHLKLPETCAHYTQKSEKVSLLSSKLSWFNFWMMGSPKSHLHCIVFFCPSNPGEETKTEFFFWIEELPASENPKDWGKMEGTLKTCFFWGKSLMLSNWKAKRTEVSSRLNLPRFICPFRLWSSKFILLVCGRQKSTPPAMHNAHA